MRRDNKYVDMMEKLQMSQEEKELSGVYDDMIRISVGIEDIEDLKEDFKRVIEGDDENGKS